MTCEKNSEPRSNFASRMLNKAIAERTKTGELRKPVIVDENKTESFAPPVEAAPTVAAK